MAAAGHALLGPSSSHRWLNCTPAARLEERVEDKGSDFAQEGSCAHALCEEKLHLLLGNSEDAKEARMEQDKHNRERWYSQEMESATDEYVAVVYDKYREALKKTSDARLFIERQLSFERWVPESFGTADAIIIADGTMEVIDFKYGKGVEVSADGNTQMMIYALGAVGEFELEYRIDYCRMTIIQPRMYNTSEYELPVSALTEWADKILKPKARLAWEGKGDQHAGEWCRFCKIKARCSALANQAISVYTQHECKEQISDEDYPKILSLVPAIKTWVSAVEDYATARAIDGHRFEGYKLVEGRSIRKVTDADELASRLSGHTDADLYKPRELKTIGELERLVGKKKFAELSNGLINKPPGKPTLVPVSDKREELNTNSAVNDFANVVLDSVD